MPTRLSELEQDALSELINIGVSRAAVSLSMMTGEEVLLTVPAISTVPPDQAAEMLGGAAAGPLLAVTETFAGAMNGQAFLIFPESNGLELARAVTREEMTADQLADMAPEAVCETGNVILQTCLSTMANMLQRTFDIGAPRILRLQPREIFPVATGGLVLFVYINFRLRGRRIRGYIVFLMDIPSMDALRGMLAELIEREAP